MVTTEDKQFVLQQNKIKHGKNKKKKIAKTCLLKYDTSSISFQSFATSFPCLYKDKEIKNKISVLNFF